MWIEKEPKEGDTVKIEFADWTDLGTRIGVFVRKSIDNYMIVDFGRTLRYFDRFTSFLVYEKTEIN